jgi:T4 RnlA family RNA ligase
MKRLLTYNEALALTVGKDAPFYESKLVVNGYNVSIFNYRLAMYSDFIDNDAFEMRGLTFVFNSDGSLFKRYLLLHKFFNLNQVSETQYSLVSDYVIKSIYNKEDGSVASFIRLPNGDVVGKSKMSFESEQALGMNRLYNSNPDLKVFIDWSLDNDLVAVFEYVAPHNRIVLKYSDEELILLRLRDNKTGEYLDLSDYSDKIGSVKVAKFEDNKSLDELIELAHTVEDKEGWIVQFERDHLIDFLKIKTSWYCSLHGLLTDDLYREHILVKYILEDKIDDVLGQIPENEIEMHERIHKIINVVKHSVVEKVADILKSYDLFLECGVDRDWEGDLRLQLMRKTFALKYRKDKNFAYVMSLSKGKDVYDLAKDWVSDRNRKLLVSREFLKERDPSLFFVDVDDDIGE